jgi:GT2 family glycosyltransferase
MLLSIIIVSYNTKALTLQTLESVDAAIRTSTRLKRNTEVFVVDNNSSDDSVRAIKTFAATHPYVHVLAQKENLGFGKANNLAAAQATGAYLLFLNSDTIVQPNALDELVSAFMAHPVAESTAHLSSYGSTLDRIGIIASQLLNTDGSIQPQGGNFPTLATLFFHMSMLDDLPLIGPLLPSTQHTGRRTQFGTPSSTLVQKDWVGGTALAIRAETAAEIGLFDPAIFMYGEDIELCLRARHHHWDVAIASTSLITHLGSASSTSENAIIGELRGYLYIWSKHKSIWQYSIAKTLLLFGCLLRALLFGTIIKDTERAAVYTNAYHQLKRATL